MEEGVHDHHNEVPHTAPYLQGELRQLPTLAKVPFIHQQHILLTR